MKTVKKSVLFFVDLIFHEQFQLGFPMILSFVKCVRKKGKIMPNSSVNSMP